MKREDIKGFTLKVFKYYIEFVFVGFLIKTIAINKRRLANKTFYLLDI